MTREEIAKAALEYANEEINAAPYDAFMAGAEWADQRPVWISVEDELPKVIEYKLLFDYSDDVLVCLKDGSITVGRWERDNSTGEQYWLLDIEKDLIVTHWMPLPQAPHHFADVSQKVKKGGSHEM